jgi:uncharacterized protein (DUF58 family)
MQPTPRAALLFGAGLPLALAPAVVDERLWLVWAAALGLALVLLLADALLLVPAGRVEVDLDLPTEMQIGQDAHCLVRLAVAGRGARFAVHGDLDPELEAWPETAVEIGADGRVELALPLRAARRGTFRLRRLWLRWSGPLGLWARTWTSAVDRSLAVVPDVRAARAVALQFFGSRAARAGLKIERFVGEGSEFESLRGWVPGLDARSVDWKASARHRRLLCRRFRAERNHQIVVAIDAGHLMGEPLDGLPRIDHAIERGLALAYLSLRSGDRVGLYAFDARPRRFVEPEGGVRAFPRLRHASAAIEYGTAETNFALGMLELTRRLRRRSLVVVFTEFADAVTAELMLDHIARLARRHLILFVALRDPRMEALELDPPERLSDLHRAVVAAGMRAEREKVFERLRRVGVQVVDALPQDATVQVLNRYLEIKRRELV